MSHRAYTRVLSHHQPVGSRTRTAIPAEVAEELVQRMAAEQISQGVIRMMAPDSVFLRAVREVLPDIRYDPTNFSLGPMEVNGSRYRPPSDPAWQELHAMAARSLRTRSYLTFKAWKQELELGATA